MRFNLRTVVWIGFLLSTGLFLGGAEGQGCGGKSVFESMADDSTDEAKLEKAKIALDDGEFADAVEILADLCGTDLTAPSCDPEVVSLYASAYAGRAGLAVFDLVKEAVDKTPSNNESYALFSAHFSAPTSSQLSDMNNAVILLSSLPVRTPAQGLQLAVATVVDIVVLLGTKTDGYDSDGRPNQMPTTQDLDDLTPIQGLTLINRVSRDVNNMGLGLGEAVVNQTENDITDHIEQIQERLSNVNSTTVLDLLNF
ncbi:MAG: hypothetical protein MPW14_07720 [Candidatus Manganitrophus sp.]|nr:hypothetical protein [Candidatus Manganitrophus sp.]WDT71106.1 MAG: hypothetical protein MPW17_20570 [Candidatus Manganitrophus sp.]WDT81603.1 MAG: hypothetical protein MPW14_07720 [Candidatus Manganitrophus sp.]